MTDAEAYRKLAAIGDAALLQAIAAMEQPKPKPPPANPNAVAFKTLHMFPRGRWTTPQRN